MKNSFAPTYQKSFKNYWVLWYNISNTYSVVDSVFKNLLDTYFLSENEVAFCNTIREQDETIFCNDLLNTINEYLKNCNTQKTEDSFQLAEVDTSKRLINKQYEIYGKAIAINYDSELVMKVIHPSLAYLETDSNTASKVCFDIYLKDEFLHLFKEDILIIKVHKLDYHLLQGKFIMELLCTLHNKSESDWIGTFHGSTISDGNSCIMFAGLSGKGKSTLTAILAANGLELVADDVSPLLFKDQKIYNNPAAISIKKGAFPVLKSLIKNFEDYKTVMFNKSKGFIKYVPFPKHKKKAYPCKAIILVNFKAEEETALQPINVNEVLEALIPDSWLLHNSKYAEVCLNWLATLQFYQLTYSDNDEAVATVSQLFKTFKN